MRSIAEIDADIAAVQQRIADRNAGAPSRNSPEYRAARFDYIVNGDRSGIDAYANAMQSAIQNKLNRESTEKLAALNKESAKEEDEIAWRKDMTNARSDLNDVRNKYNQGLATDKDVEDAVANYNFHAERGAKKGYSNAPSAESVIAPKKPEEPGLDPTAKNDREFVKTIAAQDSASIEDLKSALAKAEKLQMSSEKATISDKIHKIEGADEMAKADKAIGAAILTKDPKKILAAADAYDKFAELNGYDPKKSGEARNKANAISKANAGEKVKSEVGKTITDAMARTAFAKDENAKKLAVKDPNTGKEYTFKLQSVTRDGKEVLQVFYGGEWHDVKPKVK